MPGCGKSTLARALCEAGEADFIDLDSLVELRARSTVPAIMRLHGEDTFRRLETEALQAAAGMAANSGRPLVVATGGGTPCFGANMDIMLASGLVVWLQAGEERSLQRLAAAPGQRPAVDRAMADGSLRQWFEQLHAARSPHYSRAHARFDTTELDTPRAVALAVDRFADAFLRGSEPRCVKKN